MKIQLDIDSQLAGQVLVLTGADSVDEAISTALSEFIRLKQYSSIRELFGTLELDGTYDYKRERARN